MPTSAKTVHVWIQWDHLKEKGLGGIIRESGGKGAAKVLEPLPYLRTKKTDTFLRP